MATETEIVITRFHANPNVRTAAAVTTDARAFAAVIEVVVMTHSAVHRAVPVVRKVQHQALTTAQERFTQGEGCATARQRNQRGE